MPRKMNKAQTNIVALIRRVPLEDEKTHDFLQAVIEAWQGYDDMHIGYPHHQLLALEKEYEMTLKDVSREYDRPLE